MDVSLKMSWVRFRYLSRDCIPKSERACFSFSQSRKLDDAWLHR